MPRLLVPCALVFASASPHASGQALLQEWQGLPATTNTAKFGACCDVLPDLDGDGVPELLIGAPAESPVVKPRRDGAVYVMSGATATVVRVHHGRARAELGSDVAALEDVDGDGVGDYAAIDGPLGPTDHVIAWSGASGAVLWQAAADPVIAEAFDGRLALVHDVDGDGLRDLGVPASRGGPNPGNSLTILSSANGASIVDWKPTFPLGRVLSACRLDDLTGDGFEEFAVGHDYQEGRVEIVDGFTLGIVASLSGASSFGGTFGDHCGQVGDLDGDGIRDLVVSDQEYGWSYPPDGRVYLYSGANLAELFHLDEPRGGDTYATCFVAETSDFDFNGDGVPDVAVGRYDPLAVGWEPSGVDVWSGKSRRLLCSIPSMTAGDEGLGCALQVLDWNGDGFDDVVAGACMNAAPPMSSGMVHLFAGDDLCLAMNAPTWHGYRAGDAIEATTRGGEPNEWTLLALVDYDGSPTFEQMSLVALDGFGEATNAGVVPPGLAGRTITLQAFATRAARHGLATSAPAVVRFQ